MAIMATGRRWTVSKQLLAASGIFIIAFGVTVSTVLFSAQSLMYYIVVVTGFFMTLPFVFELVKIRSKNLIYAFFFALLFPTFLMMQDIIFRPYVDKNMYLQSLAIGLIVLCSVVSGSLSLKEFRGLMMLTAVAHMVFIVVFMSQRDFGALIDYSQRFSTKSVSVASWGEIGLGLIVAAILSGQLVVIVASLFIGGWTIFITEMRGAGLAAFVLVVFYFFHRLKESTKLIRILLTLVLWTGIGVSVMYLHTIGEFFSELLLLDDPHRGLSSGFSGRFDNWNYGLDSILKSIIIGGGDLSGHLVHNGYIKFAADFGVPLMLAMSICAFRGLKRTVSLGMYEFTAAILCYLVFIVSAPRYISFQLMPLVPILAIAFSLNRSQKAGVVGLKQAAVSHPNIIGH